MGTLKDIQIVLRIEIQEWINEGVRVHARIKKRTAKVAHLT